MFQTQHDFFYIQTQSQDVWPDFLELQAEITRLSAENADMAAQWDVFIHATAESQTQTIEDALRSEAQVAADEAQKAVDDAEKALADAEAALAEVTKPVTSQTPI